MDCLGRSIQTIGKRLRALSTNIGWLLSGCFCHSDVEAICGVTSSKCITPSRRHLEDYLQDILDAVAAIKQFTAGIEFAAFSQNLEKVFAVSRAIEIIGEAVKRIPDSVKNQYPDIPWRDIAGIAG